VFQNVHTASLHLHYVWSPELCVTYWWADNAKAADAVGPPQIHCRIINKQPATGATATAAATATAPATATATATAPATAAAKPQKYYARKTYNFL